MTATVQIVSSNDVANCPITSLEVGHYVQRNHEGQRVTIGCRCTLVELTGFGAFEDLPSILPLLFGAMVRRTIPVVKEYHSDLFHDVGWLKENVTGEAEFDFLVRPSGTNIGLTHGSRSKNSAIIGVQIGAGEGAVFYRVRVFEVSGMWFAEFKSIPLEDVK